MIDDIIYARGKTHLRMVESGWWNIEDDIDYMLSFFNNSSWIDMII